MDFRNLTEKELKCRMQQVGKAGVELLLYKDARCDMDILDETVGAENWECRYSENKGILFCSIGINVNYYDPHGIPLLVWKEDAGTESNMEADKGAASDAFKRAGFRWGIGRALYTCPKLFVYALNNKTGEPNAVITFDDKKQKYVCYDKFSVERIKYSDDGKRIIGISIWNDSLNKRALAIAMEEATK